MQENIVKQIEDLKEKTNKFLKDEQGNNQTGEGIE